MLRGGTTVEVKMESAGADLDKKNKDPLVNIAYIL